MSIDCIVGIFFEIEDWFIENYPNHIQDGCINVKSFEAAAAKRFNLRPSEALHGYVIEFCLDIQTAATKAQAKIRKDSSEKN